MMTAERLPNKFGSSSLLLCPVSIPLVDVIGRANDYDGDDKRPQEIDHYGSHDDKRRYDQDIKYS
jgi:hypothetical protein